MVVARDMPAVHISGRRFRDTDMSKAKSTKTKRPASESKQRPRQQHPFHVGCTHEEADLLARGAAALETGPVTLLREAGLDAARDVLGLGEGEF